MRRSTHARISVDAFGTERLDEARIGELFARHDELLSRAREAVKKFGEDARGSRSHTVGARGPATSQVVGPALGFVWRRNQPCREVT